MSITIIIAVCLLLLLAYIFDIGSKYIKIPSVILLLFLGWLTRQTASWFNVNIPDLNPLLPILGTIGLILIVLEGSLELEFNRSKTPVIRKSLIASVVPMFLLAALLTIIFKQVGGATFKISLANAIPFCIISSAIAIPSVKSLTRNSREFVIYESSLSDIIGVLFFNFVILNESFGMLSVGNFILQLFLIALISFVATIILVVLLNKIEHKIKFAPIILLIILIYSVSKAFHLPGLLFILLFGLFLGNTEELKHYKWMNKFNPGNLGQEVHKFKELTIEGTFIIRAFFFILFGFLIETREIVNLQSLPWALLIVGAIFIIRLFQLKLSGLTVTPLLFIAPRGLITILLYLEISPGMHLDFVNRSLIIQVIILTALAMIGLMVRNGNEEQKQSPQEENTTEKEAA